MGDQWESLQAVADRLDFHFRRGKRIGQRDMQGLKRWIRRHRIPLAELGPRRYRVRVADVDRAIQNELIR